MDSSILFQKAENSSIFARMERKPQMYFLPRRASCSRLRAFGIQKKLCISSFAFYVRITSFCILFSIFDIPKYFKVCFLQNCFLKIYLLLHLRLSNIITVVPLYSVNNLWQIYMLINISFEIHILSSSYRIRSMKPLVICLSCMQDQGKNKEVLPSPSNKIHSKRLSQFDATSARYNGMAWKSRKTQKTCKHDGRE